MAEMEKVMEDLARLKNTAKTCKEITSNNYQEVLTDLNSGEQESEHKVC